MSERILVSHKAALGTWEKAIRAYNAGRGNWRCAAARRYYLDVRALGHWQSTPRAAPKSTKNKH